MDFASREHELAARDDLQQCMDVRQWRYQVGREQFGSGVHGVRSGGFRWPDIRLAPVGHAQQRRGEGSPDLAASEGLMIKINIKLDVASLKREFSNQQRTVKKVAARAINRAADAGATTAGRTISAD